MNKKALFGKITAFVFLFLVVSVLFFTTKLLSSYTFSDEDVFNKEKNTSKINQLQGNAISEPQENLTDEEVIISITSEESSYQGSINKSNSSKFIIEELEG